MSTEQKALDDECIDYEHARLFYQWHTLWYGAGTEPIMYIKYILTEMSIIILSELMTFGRTVKYFRFRREKGISNWNVTNLEHFIMNIQTGS